MFDASSLFISTCGQVISRSIVVQWTWRWILVLGAYLCSKLCSRWEKRAGRTGHTKDLLDPQCQPPYWREGEEKRGWREADWTLWYIKTADNRCINSTNTWLCQELHHFVFNLTHHSHLFCMVHLVFNWKLIKKCRKKLSLPAWPVGVCILCSVWVQYFWHPGVACFDTYSRPKPIVRLPLTPQVSPSPWPAWLKRIERGNCCFPARLSSKLT